MKIIITENQLEYIIKKQNNTKVKEKECLPKPVKEWNEVDYSVKNVKDGKILNYGDKDTKNGNALKKIQKKLGVGVDGEYGVGTLKALAKKLKIDLCKQKDYNIPIGPNGIKKLGIEENIKLNKDNLKDFSENGKASKGIKDFIKSFEKLRLNAYDIKDGKITIGYGHTEGVKIGDKITKKQAEEFFKEDIQTAEDVVIDILSEWKEAKHTYNITQSMFDALVSLAYNSGRGTLRNATVKGSKFLSYLKKGDYKTASEKIETYALRDGYSGLIERRKDESKWFCKEGC